MLLAAAEYVPGLSDKVSFQDYKTPIRDGAWHISVRVYRPKCNIDGPSASAPLPVYLFFHGGGFIFGSEKQDEFPCSSLAVKHGMIIANANYRHTPRWTYPVQHNDAWDALEWLLGSIDGIGGDRSNVIVGEVSAGANLAAYIVHRHQRLQRAIDPHQSPRIVIRGLVLDMPWLVHPHVYPMSLRSQTYQSYVQCADAPVLPIERLFLFTHLLGPIPTDQSSLMHVSLAPKELDCMPPTVIFIAGNDPFRDEAWEFARKLNGAQIPLLTYIFPGMPHAFWRFEKLEAARMYRGAVQESFDWLLTRKHAKPEPGIKVKVIGDLGNPNLTHST